MTMNLRSEYPVTECPPISISIVGEHGKALAWFNASFSLHGRVHDTVQTKLANYKTDAPNKHY